MHTQKKLCVCLYTHTHGGGFKSLKSLGYTTAFDNLYNKTIYCKSLYYKILTEP